MKMRRVVVRKKKAIYRRMLVANGDQMQYAGAKQTQILRSQMNLR